MCDTILAAPRSPGGAAMLFGKNSDRQRNEAQAVEYFPSASHTPQTSVQCTYITIPQTQQTYAVLLCRPFWIWGAEMGANEHGVVIGNEGLHARIPPPNEDALTGMDLVRLALERSATATEAVEVMTTLLERHGQGGNCGHITPSYYNNGFMIADAGEAFVLETVGREWLVERVGGVRAMSNRYSIDREPHRVSAGLAALMRDAGWSADVEQSYADAIADPRREHLGNAIARRACSTSLLSSLDGRVSVAHMMSILRDHGRGDRFHPEWRADCTSRRTLCMHAGVDDHAGQTVGSIVCELYDDGAVHWVTGTAAPCMSIFKPVFMDVPLPAHGPRPTDRSDPRTLWWRHERLHRSALRADFARFLEDIRPERDALEADFQSNVKAALQGGSVAERSRVVAACWKAAIEMEERWYSRIDSGFKSADAACASAWAKMSELAAMDL